MCKDGKKCLRIYEEKIGGKRWKYVIRDLSKTTRKDMADKSKPRLRGNLISCHTGLHHMLTARELYSGGS